MSGHNKWSKIKHKKAATDAQKSRVFGKLAKFIATESKRVSGDENAPGLRAAIEKARAANMPAENISRAVQKGKTDKGALLEEVVYEAYGPGGVAMILTGLTDNRNRTAAEIKHLLGKHDLALAEPGAASWAFEKKVTEYLPKTMVNISDEERRKLESVREVILEQEDMQEVYTNEA